MADPISEHPMRNFVAMLMGQYPYAAPDNPTIYRLSLAEMFAAYPETAVKACCSPVRGLATEPSEKFGLPEMSDVRSWLERWVLNDATMERYAKMQPPPPRVAIGYMRTAPVAKPNLFVPDSMPRYPAMLRLHEEGGGRESYHETRDCTDGVRRSGLWVPQGWYYAGASTSLKPINSVMPTQQPERKAS